MSRSPSTCSTLSPQNSVDEDGLDFTASPFVFPVSLRLGDASRDRLAPFYIKGSFCSKGLTDTLGTSREIGVQDIDAPPGLERVVESVLGDDFEPAGFSADPCHVNLGFAPWGEEAIATPPGFEHVLVNATQRPANEDWAWDAIVAAFGMDASQGDHVSSISYGIAGSAEQSLLSVQPPYLGKARDVSTSPCDFEAQLALSGFPSVGSLGHHSGTCKPCAFVHTKGCANGLQCSFCHLCLPGSVKSRRKEKKLVKYQYKNAVFLAPR